MRLTRLAELLVAKHKFAASAAESENLLRREINLLWNIPNKSFNILKACAESGASKPKDAKENIAVLGHKFCKQLLSLIDYLKSNMLDIPLVEMREVLLNIANLIDSNKDLKFNAKGKVSEDGEVAPVQFPHVSELIFQITPIRTKHEIKLRNELQGKARTGLSRILSICSTMLDEISQLEVMDPTKFKAVDSVDPEVNIEQVVPERFSPQRAPLSNYDILDFIRQHGDKYGISNTEDWELAFRNDPALKEDITTVINALNRGHSPRNGLSVKDEIAQILQQHKDRKGV